MFAGGNIDILTALIAGAVIAVIWLIYFVASDDDWRDALRDMAATRKSGAGAATGSGQDDAKSLTHRKDGL